MYEALKAFSHGEVERVDTILDAVMQEKATRMNIDDILSVCCMRASTLAMQGKNQRVVEVMELAAGAPQHAALTCYLEGLAALANINLQTARLKFEEAKRRDEHFTLAHLGLAAVYYQLGDYKTSFSEYREVLSVLGSTATPPIVRVGMGLCAYHLGRPAEARAFLEHALQINPNDALALFALLVVYLDRRLTSKVVETVARLSKMLPHNTMVLLKVSDLMYFKAISQRRIKSSIPAIKSTLDEVRRFGSIDECALADFQEGRLLLASGDLSGAQPLLESALRTFPKLLAARVHYARLLVLSHRENEAAQLLEKINQDQPNQKEVLQLLAVHATRLGQHERAFKYCSLLTTSVAEGDLRSWSLASWCARLDTDESKCLLTHLIHAHKKLGLNPPWQLQANIAVLSGDTDAMQAIVDHELGGDFLHREGFAVQHVPLVFNLALLLEAKDRARARELYIFLVKQQSGFRLPYLRLHKLCKEAGLHEQAVAWLVLLQQVIPQEPMAQAALGQIFFEQKLCSAALNILTNPKTKAIPVALTLGATYLRYCQQYGRDSREYLRYAKYRYKEVLRVDKGNILAAHGLACCVGLELNCTCCQSLLDHVGEVTPNCAYVRDNHLVHMANVKVLSERYKQAIDYLEANKFRTPQQDSSYTFCLASEGRYDDAIEVLSKVLDSENPQHILFYNMSLLCCSAFLRQVAKSHILKADEGRKMRGILEKGLMAAHKFLQLEAKSKFQVENRAFIKSVSVYCIEVYDTRFKRLLAVGQDNSSTLEKMSELWRDTFSGFQTEIQRQEEDDTLLEAKKKAERETYEREILENFRKSHSFYMGATMDDLDAPDLVTDEMEPKPNDPLHIDGISGIFDGVMPMDDLQPTDHHDFA
ncbi:unnamed protein product [Phytomonas sp. EM1]|nr:unnamed protein product [Phytomonas sp. EM1]|eukprot:CCW59743.1 unnamed protein product [Phytomonas sp. isolate EM1]